MAHIMIKNKLFIDTVKTLKMWYFIWKSLRMNYNEIDVDKIVNEVSIAVAQGNYRKATKKESMEVRLAAIALLVKNMQGEMHNIVEHERELAHA
jgi:hypothetical protein